MSFTNIFHDGILVDVNVSFWSGSKVLEPRDLGLKDDDVTEAFHLGKKLLIPQEVIHAFRAIESKARREVEINSFPFPIGNARFVPRKKFKQILANLRQYQADYSEKTNDLISNYESYRQQMLPLYEKAAETAFTNRTLQVTTFGPDLDQEKKEFIQEFLDRVATYYPPAESLRARFGLSWDVFEISMPRLHEGDADDITNTQDAQEEYQKQIHDKIGSFVGDVVKALRKETADICSRVVENIKAGKVIKSRTLTSLKDFIDRFKELNFVGDTLVEDQLNELRTEFLDKYSSQELQDNTDLQEQLTRKLGELSGLVDVNDINTITGEYKRKISWE